MEAFLDFERRAEIKDGGTSIVVFERWMQTRDHALLDQIAAYNEEDCIATLLLRDWLLERRAEALAQFGPFPLPEPVEPKPIPEVKVERAALRDALCSTRARSSPRSCSTTTTASASRSGGRSSTASR